DYLVDAGVTPDGGGVGAGVGLLPGSPPWTAGVFDFRRPFPTGLTRNWLSCSDRDPTRAEISERSSPARSLPCPTTTLSSWLATCLAAVRSFCCALSSSARARRASSLGFTFRSARSACDSTARRSCFQSLKRSAYDAIRFMSCSFQRG